ncbi:hypothetical protein [uncultured Zoogloea sp.]|uniref:hypothetical protein n=1 Tax=uncultured Zoogloea sp. TaxID=160237 RepID=UPI0026258B7F|nr:hypothetical protein [uncultured Zoogloea sp.]
MNRIHASGAATMKGLAAAKPSSAIRQSMLVGERSMLKGELLMFEGEMLMFDRQHKGLERQLLMFEAATFLRSNETFLRSAATFLRSDEVFLRSTETKGLGVQQRPRQPARFLRIDASQPARPAEAIAEHHNKTVSPLRTAA